jgi:hypothetical protein
MKENKKLSLSATASRKNERGVALLTMLLISTLLLASAGALVLTTGMSNTTAIDATAEVQAYYGAEAGLQAALNVLRGNVAPGAGLPAGTQMGFRNAVTRNISGNFASDLPATTIPKPPTRLSSWLTYDANNRVVLNNNFLSYCAFQLEVSDADDPNGTTLTADPNYIPRRLIVRSTGYGPKGAIKRMEAMVQRVDLDFTARAMLAMRSSDPNPITGLPGPPMTFDIGASNAKHYSGADNDGSAGALATFGVTSVQDQLIAQAAITKPGTVDATPQVRVVPLNELPSWLQTADKAREYLSDIEAVARTSGSYYSSFSGQAGTTAQPKFTFVDGNCSLSGGAGLLVVTGTLTMSGNPDFDGIILVLGAGRITRNGGGNGAHLGAVQVAAFQRTWPSTENNLPHPFLAPVFDTNGGGNSDMLYDSAWVRRAQNLLGVRIRDVREY